MYSMTTRPPPLIDGKLPVFVFPTSLTFYSDDQASHKQILTLYNPYDFALKFKVLSTAPRKYTLVDSEGSIKPRCCVDLIVRHTDICISNEGVHDKFRVQVSEYGERKIIGKKDVAAVLLPTSDKHAGSEDHFEQIPSAAAAHSAQESILARTGGGSNSSGPGFVVLLAALMCIVALMLPLDTDTGSSLPKYLQLTVNQKLIAAYILGLVTMTLLRT